MLIVNYLEGSGHFAVGFCFGFLLMFFLVKKYHTYINVQMYTPFIPFIFGIWASLPYVFINELKEGQIWLNIFLFFNFMHHNELIIKIFGRIILVALICGSLYLYILLHYINLVKYCRRYGWHKEDSNAR